MLVDLLCRNIQPKHVGNLALCITFSASIEHTQQIAHTDGGHDKAAITMFLLVDGAEQVASKIIVAFSYLALSCGRCAVFGKSQKGTHQHEGNHCDIFPSSFHISQND